MRGTAGGMKLIAKAVHCVNVVTFNAATNDRDRYVLQGLYTAYCSMMIVRSLTRFAYHEGQEEAFYAEFVARGYGPLVSALDQTRRL